MQLTATKKRIKISYRIAEKIEKIKTLEGEMMALVGDYIITGINGEVYPCKPDIFLKTYDLEGQENQSPLTQEDREPRQNWEYEFKKRFSDMVTSAIWYTPVKEFIINLLAAKDREADERVRQLEKKIKLTKEDEELEKLLPNSLSQDEKQGVLKVGGENATATILANEVHRTSEPVERGGKKLSSRQLKNREAQTLEEHAKNSGTWIEKEFGKPDAEGA